LTAQALSGILKDVLFLANGTILMENRTGAGQKKAPDFGIYSKPVKLNLNRGRLCRRSSLEDDLGG
jgi:hypothetical protein